MSTILALVVMAQAAPLQVTHTARLTDANGAPLEGAQTLHVRLFDAGTTGANVWDDDFAVTLQDGYTTVVLGSQEALPSSVFDRPEVWLELQVGTAAPMAPRTRLVSVPYALDADTAHHVPVLTTTPSSTCSDPGAIVYDATLPGLRVCHGGVWEPPVPPPCVVPWRRMNGNGTLSNGIGTNTVYSASPAATNYSAVVLSYDFTDDFEVIARWPTTTWEWASYTGRA